MDNWNNMSLAGFGQMGGGGMQNLSNAAADQFGMMGGGGAQNMQSLQAANISGQFGQTGGGGSMQGSSWGGGGMPTFSQFNQWSSQMGQRPQQSSPYQVGQNKPIDSNAQYRDVYGPNGALANGATLGSPYGMQQSNQNRWNGSGWESTSGTPAQSGWSRPPGDPNRADSMSPTFNYGGSRGMFSGANLPPRSQSERPQQQWNPGPNTGTRTPYQIQPGGPGPISMDPRSQPGNRFTPVNDVYPGPRSPQPQPWGPNPGPRPRPQQPPTLTNQQGPSTQANGAPWFRPVERPPQSAFGQQNPTRFISGFHPQGPAPWNPSAGGPQQQGPYRML